MLVINEQSSLALEKIGLSLAPHTKVQQCLMYRGPISTNFGCFLEQCKIDRNTRFAEGTQCIRADIGRYCDFGQGVRIGQYPEELLVNQGFSGNKVFTSRSEFLGYTYSSIKQGCEWSADFKQEPGLVHIGHDVRIGPDAMISSGVTIGTGAIVIGGACISKDVAPYTIVSGADYVERQRFSDEQISDLLELKWWDYDLLKMHEQGFSLESSKVDEFIAKFKDLPQEQLVKIENEWTLLVVPNQAIQGAQYFTSKVPAECNPFELKI